MSGLASQLCVAGVCVSLLGASGCRPGMSAGEGPTVSPGAGPPRDVAGEGPDAGENLGTYKRQLEEYRGALRANQASSLEPSFAVCEDLCSLMTSICQVKTKLCVLADDNPAEDEYQGLCREAQHECREAQDSCVACTETSGGDPER